MPEEEKTKKKESEAELVEVTTQTTEAFKLEDGSVVTANMLLLQIYNDVQKLKKGLL